MMLVGRRRALMMAQDLAPSGRLPKEYQEVTWVGVIDSNSKEDKCRINTGFVAKSQECKLETDFFIQSAASRCAFGFLESGAPTWTLYCASSYLYYKFGGTSYGNRLSISASVWYHGEFSKSAKINGTTMTTMTDYDMSNNTRPLYLFTSAGTNPNARLKEIRIWDENGDLVRHFVPCYRKTDGRMGFYCLVTEAFYYNTGGAVSDLKKGADVT